MMSEIINKACYHILFLNCKSKWKVTVNGYYVDFILQ